MRTWTVCSTAAAIMSALLTTSALAGPRQLRDVSPPAQPVTGPGSSDYPHAAFTQLKFGSGAQAYYLFQPAEPKPVSAPVVVFFHGFAVPHAGTYMAWITHLVRNGNSVIFPVYQTDNDPPVSRYVDAAIVSIRNGLNALSSRDHVRPELDKIGFVAHSLGSLIATNIAVRAPDAGLPVPRCILLTHAYDAGDGRRGTYDSLLDDVDYADLSGDTLLLAVVATGDRVTYDAASEFILAAAMQVPPANKEILSISSDRHGVPPLQATHDAPSNWTPANALDFYGYWKWGDALLDTAFYGANREYAFGGTFEQTFMGLWSDGVPVIPAVVIGP